MLVKVRSSTVVCNVRVFGGIVDRLRHEVAVVQEVGQPFNPV